MAQPGAAPSPTARHVIAILPFDNVSGAAVDDWLGRGIAESVTADFVAQGDVTVVDRTRVLAAFERAGLRVGAGEGMRAVGAELDVAYVVTGGYQRVGDRLRLTARLVALDSGTVVAGTIADGAVGDLFTLQDRIGADLVAGLTRERIQTSRSTAARLPTPRSPAEGERLETPPAETPASEATGAELPPPSSRVTDTASLTLDPERRFGIAGGGTLSGSVGFPALVPAAPAPPVPPDVIRRNDTGQATLRAVRLDDALSLDGALDERVYQNIPAITDFIQVEPDAGQPATEKTEAWLLFDDTNVYIAARAWDSSPESQWIANEMRRDNFNVAQNEHIAFSIDTFYDRRNSVMFTITPIGGRMDGQFTNERDLNLDWNPIWDVRTGRFEGGWSFEARIPFKSLRYRPGRAQIWGFQMRRQVRWKNEMSFIVPLDQGLGRHGLQQASQSPTLVGLEAPQSRSPIEIKPYVIGDVSSDLTSTPAVSNELAGNMGIDLIKYGVTQNLTADFTINTDFAQVEADEQQVNLTRFSLFFPEKREFFLENQGVFQFGTSGSLDAPILFYSRRIGLNEGREVPILAGGRLTGRAGAFTIGLVNIQTDDEPSTEALTTNFSVVRIRRDLLRRSSFGAIFTNRSVSTGSPAPGSNQAYGVDAALAFYDNLSINGYWARTQTTGITGDDTSYSGDLRYNGDRFSVIAEHLFIDRNFSPEIGFLRRDDMRKSFGSFRFSPRPQAIDAIRKVGWEGSYNHITDASGFVETREGQGLFDIEFENSDGLAVTYTDTYDFLKEPFKIADGLVVPIGGYDFYNAQVGYSFGAQRRLSGNVAANYGTFYGGTKTTIAIGGSGRGGGRVELSRQLSIEPGLSVNWVDLPQGDFTTTFVTTRATYSMTPRMFVSALVQYNSDNNALSTNLRLRWEYQPGSELFIVYNEQRDTLAPTRYPELENRAFIVKVNKLFRF